MGGDEFENQFNILYEKLDLFWKDIKKRKEVLRAMRSLIIEYLEGSDEND